MGWGERERGMTGEGCLGVGMAGNKLGEAGGQAVAEALMTNTTLTQLNLRGE